MSYNGWSNRQTWLLKVHDFFEGAWREGEFESVDELADAMESMFDEWLTEHEPENLLVRDFMDATGIDFHELAENYAEDFVLAPEDEEEDEEEDDEDDEDDTEDEG